VKTGLAANAESFSSVERGRKAEMNLGKQADSLRHVAD